ncbi:MAG: UDP-N-acetylmuramoyl-L-alanine--D-glutamate ligase [Clostridiales bacterium]|jgi:UDP-N-acetylmuramoylalanine--D-glutamate ligase|nr:UDP-N-acetylmuramoyl-L-alanine--D-glutamate ligase [Clostridiales bacterium]
MGALVIGMARSGISSAVLLKKQGYDVTIDDKKEEKNFDQNIIFNLRGLGVNLNLGSEKDISLQGVSLIVLSPGVPKSLDIIKKARQENIRIIGEVELAYTYFNGGLIAITGTNGKTTTTALVGAIMNAYCKNTYTLGNIGVAFTEKVLEADKNSTVVLEASSFQLESIDKFRPHIAAILNIAEDHLDRHLTMGNYINAKKEIYKNQGENDFLVLNYNDAHLKDINTKSRLIYFSSQNILNEGVYLEGNDIYINMFGINQKLINIYELNLLGMHNYENVMAAAAISLCAGAPYNIIQDVLKSFKSVPHRIEYVDTINGVEFYNDSKGTNPDAAIKSIQAMRKPILLIAGGYEKNSDFNPWIKEFKNKVKHVVVLGQAAGRIISDLKGNNFYDFSHAESLGQAVDIAFFKAKEGDCILLSPACASWGMFRDFEHRGDVFKNKVRSLKEGI